MPLRVRLALLFALGTSVVLALAGVLFYLQLRANLQASLDANLAARIDVLATGFADTDVPAPAELLGGGAPAQLLGEDGQVVTTTPEAGTQPLATGRRLAEARAGPVTYTTDSGRGTIRVLAEPARVAGRPAILVVGASTNVIDNAEDRIRDVMLVATAPTVALSGLAAWVLSGAALRPVERMRRQAAAMGVADTSAYLDVPSTHDEIAALGETMNDLLGRLHGALLLDRAFVADAGHELRTPLTILRAELELALRPGRSHADLTEAIVNASVETERLIRLSEELLALARMDADTPVRRERMSLTEVLAASVGRARGQARAAGVDIRLDTGGPLDIRGDPDRLRQAVDNLLANAIRYAPTGTTIEVGAHAVADTGPAAILVEVRDRGPGFPPEFLPRAFERFSRADDARARRDGGAGLGLAIVAAISRAHGGYASAANRPGGGAVVSITVDATGA